MSLSDCDWSRYVIAYEFRDFPESKFPFSFFGCGLLTLDSDLDWDLDWDLNSGLSIQSLASSQGLFCVNWTGDPLYAWVCKHYKSSQELRDEPELDNNLNLFK